MNHLSMGKIKELMTEPRDYLVFYRDFKKDSPIFLKSFDDIILMQVPDSDMKNKIMAVLQDKEYIVINAQIKLGDINILEEKEMTFDQVSKIMKKKKK